MVDWAVATFSGSSLSMSSVVSEIAERESLSRLGVLGQFFGGARSAGDDFFRTILDALPAAVYTTDAVGTITYFNEAAVALWGQRPELGASEWCGSWKLYWPDGRPMPHDQCPMAVALKEGRAVRGLEGVAERPDGSRVPFIPYPTPIHDASGVLIGAVNMLVDVSDRNRAGEYAQRLAAIVTSSDDAILSKDLNGTITSWNDGAQRLFGYTAEEVIGQPVTMLMPPERRNEEPGILARIRRGERIDHYETVRQRKDGTPIDISLTVSPIRNSDGEIVGASKVARDISELKRARETQQLLVGEMKHRVRNTLATVQAIATQTLRGIPVAERDAFLARLRALASAHDLLTFENWNSAPLSDVVSSALNAFKGSHGERLQVAGPDDVWLDAHKSMLISMTLHELTTNAIKYGALSNESGRVKVAWARVPDSQRVTFVWRESGGPEVAAPQRKGFGSTLIERALAREIGSVRYDFDPAGVICTLEIAL